MSTRGTQLQLKSTNRGVAEPTRSLQGGQGAMYPSPMRLSEQPCDGSAGGAWFCTTSWRLRRTRWRPAKKQTAGRVVGCATPSNKCRRHARCVCHRPPVNPDLPHRIDVAAVCPGFLSPSSPIQRASMRSQPMLAGRCQTPQPHSVSCSGGTLPLCDHRRTAKKEPAKPSQASTLELCPVIVAVKHRLSALLSQRGLASHRLTSNKTRLVHFFGKLGGD